MGRPGRRGKEYLVILNLLKNNPLSLAGIIIVLGFILVALFAPVIAPYPSDVTDVHLQSSLRPVSWEHLFGTDDMGRDIFSRVILGSRISLEIAVVVIAVSLGVGIPMGAAAGYMGGWIDETIMRLTDMFLAFPSILLAMAIAAALGPSLTNTMIAISLAWWPWYTRLVRGQALSIRERTFVEAAKAMGVSQKRIIFQHILPHTFSSIIVQISMDIGYVILTAAGLGFVGLGAQPPAPEWGLMISIGRTFMPQWWWYATFPGLAIMIAVLGFNFLGDALRDIMDPRLRI
jgi:peptide/nickel transport system permease protein